MKNGFDKNYILEKLSQIEDGETAVSHLVVKGEYDDEVIEEIKNLAEVTGNLVVTEYSEVGKNGYEATGIFNFIPVDDDELTEILAANIVVSDEIDEIGIYDMYEIIPENPNEAYDMYKLINMVNNRLVTGRFVLSDDEKVLAYRNNIILSRELDNKEALNLAVDQLLGALGEVSLWVDVLMGYNDGDMSPEECIEAINENSVFA